MSNSRKSRSTLTDTALGEWMSRHEEAIFEQWLTELSEDGEQGKTAYRDVVDERAQGIDLLRVLIGYLGEAGRDAAEHRARIRAKVRESRYSILDLMCETTCLRRAVEHTLDSGTDLTPKRRQAARRRINRWLDGTLRSIVSDTSAVYEHMVETGTIAFCQLDADAQISFANHRANELLGTEDAPGRPLAEFLDEAGRRFLEGALRSEATEICDVTIHGADGMQRVVSLELGPLMIDTRRVGTYVTLSDISRLTRQTEDLFNRSPLGLLRIDRDQRFTYANPAFRELLGVDDLRGRHVSELIRDPEDLATVEKHLKRRIEGVSSTYPIVISSPEDEHKKIPVSVTGIPIFDAVGAHAGSFAVVRDRTVPMLVNRIQTLLNKFHDLSPEDICTIDRSGPSSCKEILASIAAEIEAVVPFELFVLTRYSRDGTHACPIFQYGPRVQSFQKRWFTLSDNLRRWVSEPEVVVVGDFKHFIETEGAYLSEEPSVRSFIEQGLLSFVKIPVFGEGLAATLSVWRRGRDAFSEKDRSVLEQLPSHPIVHSVLAYEDRDLSEFRYRLVTDLINCKGIEALSQRLVDGISEWFERDNVNHNVTLFQIEKQTNSMLLRAQHKRAKSDSELVLRSYRQPLDAGIMGRVYREKRREGENVGDTRLDPDYVVASGVTPYLSELCFPVYWRNEIRWILNIEDSDENAFSDEQREDIRRILDEVERVLDRMVMRYQLDATLESTSDAVIYTDEKRMVLNMNPAAQRLLGWSPNSETPLSFDHFLAGDFSATWIFDRSGLSSEEIGLRNLKGEAINALVSVSRLPAEIPGYVLTAKDLSELKRLERLEALSEVFNEIALQTQTPLSLVFSWLRRLRDQPGRSEIAAELAEKCLNQLHKVQATIDRLALFENKDDLVDASLPLDLDLRSELERTLDQFPESTRKAVDVDCPDAVPRVHADAFQLSFVLETLLSYLTRFSTDSEHVKVKVRSDDASVELEMSGVVPNLRGERNPDPFAVQTHAEIALGESAIRRIMQNHRGDFEISGTDAHRDFRIVLPLKGAER